MKKSDPYQTLLNSAFRHLYIRPRSRKELVDILSKKALTKHISQETVQKVLSRLEDMDYINDRKFAEAFVASALLGRPKGPAIIRFELKKKGLSDQTISEVLKENEEIHDEERQRHLARKALGKKGELYKKLPVLECKRKVYDYLLRRGFNSTVIHYLVDDYCEKAYNKLQETDI